MPQLKRWLFLSGIAILGLALLVLLLGIIFADYIVDILWFDSLGYVLYYWQRILYRYFIFFLVTLFFFLIFFINFWVASHYLGVTAPPPSSLRPTSAQVYKDIYKMFRTGSMWVYTPLSLLLTILIALPLFQQWEQFLFFIFGPSTGAEDPVYGNNISFYLFRYPIYIILQRRLLISFLLLLAGLALLYFLERQLLSRQDQPFPRGARTHLSVLIGLSFLMGIWGLYLERYALLYSDNHQPLFSGPGYVEMWITWTMIWVAIVMLTGAAVAFLFLFNNIRSRKALGAFLILLAGFGASLGIRYSTFVPELVQKYIVQPNEISRERPYIENNIRATLDAYRLTDVEIRDFSPAQIPLVSTDPSVQGILRNIPVWDGELLDQVYEQLQQLRTYYTFPIVNVGRYTVNDTYQQVFLSGREISYENLPPGARNWVNEHLSYTHGFGAVMTPAAQGGEEPITWFLQGIPPQSDYGINVEQPRIYYGLENYDYIIAPNSAGEIDYPLGETNVISYYDGEGGVPLSSFFLKLLFSYYYMEKNILFTLKTTPQSKILFRRNLVERIKTITPYFMLDRAPYLVVLNDGLYWIQDAYVTSKWYPYSEPYQTAEGPINYIRNSVKIVMDAYNGNVDYYVFNPEDPIIRAYTRIYPGLFKNMEQMPSEIRRHVRYPIDYFTIQMSIYAKYHQTDPEVFYMQEDIWEFAKTFVGEKEMEGPPTPYYVTLDLIEPGRFDFMLLLPMIPKGRFNLRAMPIVGCDDPYYGKLIVYNFPKGMLVYGPSQIYALINQDTAIASQFTLWDQIGSNVARGRMIILPIGEVMVYIQPVYLRSATQVKIPQLQRVIMSQGQIVVMERSLEEAYARIVERTTAEAERVERRFAPLREPGPEGAEEAPPPVQPPAVPEGSTAPQPEGSPAPE